MKEDKINSAAKAYATKNMSMLNPFGRIYDDFKAGARWHESLPLSERLTEEEKDNYRCIYSMAVRMIDDIKFVNPQLFEVFNGQMLMLKQIFGADMFKDLFTKSE